MSIGGGRSLAGFRAFPARRALSAGRDDAL